MLSSFRKISIKVLYCLFLALLKKNLMGCNLTLPLSPLCLSLSSLPCLSGTLPCCGRHSENMQIDVFLECFVCFIVHDGFFLRGWHRMVGTGNVRGCFSAAGDRRRELSTLPVEALAHQRETTSLVTCFPVCNSADFSHD